MELENVSRMLEASLSRLHEPVVTALSNLAKEMKVDTVVDAVVLSAILKAQADHLMESVGATTLVETRDRMGASLQRAYRGGR